MFDIDITQVCSWWLCLLVFSMIGQPLIFLLNTRLTDRGVFFARSMGWVTTGYIVWLLGSSGLGYSRATIVSALFLAGFLSMYVCWKNRRQFIVFVTQHWRIILFSEVVFTASFLVFTVVRILNPDLWHPFFGGEKFMELAYTNAIVRSTDFPPYDPYFAGSTLNYYYYGYFLVTLPLRLTGTPTAVAFNLAIASLFAMTVCGLFGLGYNLCATNRLYGGIRAVLAVVIFGNLAGGLQVISKLADRAENAGLPQLVILEPLARPILGFWDVFKNGGWPDYSFWAPSRVIPYTINEFPGWSFLFADLHPHVMAIPFSLLFLAFMLDGFFQLRLSARQPAQKSSRLLPTPLWFWIVLAWLLGTIAVINTWDFITYGAFVLMLLLLDAILRVKKGMGGHKAIGQALIQYLFIVSVSLGSYVFFYLHFHPAAVTGIGLVPGGSQPIEWLAMWGFWLAVGCGYLLVTSGGTLQRSPNASIPLLSRFSRCSTALPVGILLLCSLAFGFISGKWVCALLLLPLITGLIALIPQNVSPEKLFTNAMLLFGFALLAGVEILFIKDHLAHTDFFRMNTVFKFGIHAWVLLGLSAAVVWPDLLREIRQRWPKWIQRGAMVVICILFLLVSVFPILGTPARLHMRFKQEEGAQPLFTLDGMAYMKTGQYRWHPDPAKARQSMIVLASDYDAIQWLQENINGTPVIAEAPIGYYRAGGLRACSFTGLPTPIGFHQINEQRAASVTEPRYAKTVAMWEAAEPDRALQYMKELNISFIYVGMLEKIIYGEAAMLKFTKLAALGKLHIVFQNDAVTIYKLL